MSTRRSLRNRRFEVGDEFLGNEIIDIEESTFFQLLRFENARIVISKFPRLTQAFGVEIPQSMTNEVRRRQQELMPGSIEFGSAMGRDVELDEIERRVKGR